MLFHKRTRKAVRLVWIVISVLIVISMLLLFAPGLQPQPTATTATSYPASS